MNPGSPECRLSDAASLKLGTWNCQGLSSVKKDIALKLDKDILCLTETHKWRDTDNDMNYGDQPPKSDGWSGVALLVNKRVSKYVTTTGCTGSRITYCRLQGNITNYFIIGVYIPPRKKINPSQDDIYNDLESLLQQARRHECVIIMGDFNSRLSRNEPGYVGRWCIHQRRDSGGDRLLDIMKKYSLRCVSSYFQPKRRHSNAIFMNVQPQKPPSQIDYILVSGRWSTSVRNCTTAWGPAITAHGRKYDHAMVSALMKIRLKCDRRKQRKNFSALRETEIAAAHEKVIQEELDKTPRPATAKDRLQRLNSAMQAAQSTLPKKSLNPTRKLNVSQKTLQLLDERKKLWRQLTSKQQKDFRK